MEDILMMCKEVVKLGRFDDMYCIHDGCKTCPFSRFNNDSEVGCGADTDENYIKIAQEYIDEHEPKIERNDNMKTKYTYKELITEWGNISQGDRYIGLENNRGLTIYKDSDGGVAIEYEDGVLGNEVLYIDIEGLFELQKLLTLDDFEIGEEFKVKDMDGKFMKVKVFGSTMIARKADFGDISVLLYTIEDLKGATLIKIKGDK